MTPSDDRFIDIKHGGLKKMGIYLDTVQDMKETKTPVYYARKSRFDVYQHGLYVGTLELSPAEVREVTAKAVFILKPAELK